ncbi:MAG TPA: tetratricopeptide repeat protein, partial [Dokdonella sp.]
MPNPLPATSRLHGLDRPIAMRVVAAAQALEAGRVDEAERELAPVLAAFPDHPEVLRLHAGMRNLRGDHGGAITAASRGVALRPDDPLQHNTLGTVLAEAGQYDEAIASLRRCCELQPGYAVAHYNLGVLLTRCVRHDEAIVALREAVALAPAHADARALLADMLRVSGRAHEAAAEYRRILAERPWTGMAWWGLADLKTMTFEAGDIARMESALRDARASDDDRIAIGFARAKALDDDGLLAESMASLATSNEIARRRRRWDAAAFARQMAAVRAAFDAAPPVAP